LGRPNVSSPIVNGKRIGAFQLGISVITAYDIAMVNPDPTYEMSIQENKALVRRYVETINQQDYDAFDALLAPALLTEMKQIIAATGHHRDSTAMIAEGIKCGTAYDTWEAYQRVRAGSSNRQAVDSPGNVLPSAARWLFLSIEKWFSRTFREGRDGTYVL
jgi:hypothetical protein